MAVQHTPGPWFTDGASEIYGGDKFQVAHSGGPHLSSLYTGDEGHWATTPGATIDRSEEEEGANAALIAAAPDLLAQLRLVMLGLRTIIRATEVDPQTTAFRVCANGQEIASVTLVQVLAKGDAAIAAAEGR